MKQPFVSVVMPAFNAGKFIQSAIESILAQSYKYLELIIIDDASTDNTYAIARTFLSDARVKLLYNDQNQGIVYSRNKGIDVSRGKFIAILDSDDIALPKRIEQQVKYMQKHPEFACIGSFYHVIDSVGKRRTSIKVPTIPNDIVTFLLFNVSFCHSTLMLRADAAKFYQYKSGFDIIEDYELAYRISRDFSIGNLPEFTVLYRVHGSNISIEKKQRLLNLRILIDENVLKDLGIPFSDEELRIHSNFINMNEAYFDNSLRLDQLEAWIIKFYTFCMHRKQINSTMLRRILTVRWSIICYRNRFYSRLVHNELWRAFKGDYIKYNIRHIQNMVKGTLEVV